VLGRDEPSKEEASLGSDVDLERMVDLESVVDLESKTYLESNTYLETYVYVGSYSAPHMAPGGERPSRSRGIYVYRMDGEGALALVQSVDAENPSFLVVSDQHRCLYCVNELGVGENGAPLGRVSAYRIDPKNGQLRLINSQSTAGSGPCHCSVHSSGKYLLAANYGSGSFVAFPIEADGAIGPLSDIYLSRGNGSGPVSDRQEGSHAHMIISQCPGEHCFGIDLGADKLVSLLLDVERGRFTLGEVPYAHVASGAGPRHMDFHPSKPYAYVLNELSSSVDVFAFDSIRGAFCWLQSISTLPVGSAFIQANIAVSQPDSGQGTVSTAGAIAVHPSGRWLYVSNRGMDSLLRFSIDPHCGRLVAEQWQDSGGKIPRGMAIDPSGQFLWVANQNSDNLILFAIDPDTGGLGQALDTLNSPVPVDFAFYRPGE
jgi:6-phosphogluconolactonase